jgi:5'(3')-deoxyribonucleotidase
MKSRVAIDVDGVLGNFLAPCLEMFSEHYDLHLRPEDLTQWDFVGAHLTAAQAKEFWTKIGAPGFHRRIQPYEGAVEGLRELSRLAHVYIVTAPLADASTWTYERDTWLAEHFEISRSAIVHTSAKHLIKANFFVDDRPENVAAWQAEHPQECGLLWNQPYNAHATEMARVHSWAELCEAIREHRRSKG